MHAIPRRFTEPGLRSAGVAWLVCSGLVVIGGVLAGCGGGRGFGSGGEAGSDRPLDAEVVSRVDSLGLDRPTVRVTVPYGSLVFQAVAEGYRAGILVQVVARRGDEQVGGGVGRAAVTVPSEAATRDAGELVCSVPLVISAKDAIDLEVTVTGWRTSRVWRRLLAYSPRELAGLPLYFRGFTWNLPAADAVAPLLGLDIDTLRAVIDLGRLHRTVAWPPGGLTLVFRIKPAAASGDRVNRLVISANDVGPDGLTVPVNLGADQIPFGSAELNMELASGPAADADVLATAEPRSFVNLRPEWHDDREWRQQVAWLAGSITEAEQEQLGELPAAARPAVWDSLWADIGSDTGVTAVEAQRVHLLRIITADERFGRFGRGSQSDRGRILIRYGEPTRVDRHAGDRADEQQWEVWYYAGLRLRFTFVDQHGLGDFRLQETREY